MSEQILLSEIQAPQVAANRKPHTPTTLQQKRLLRDD